jgi:hypothetical protein
MNYLLEWPQIMTLPISVSQVARIIGMSHQHPPVGSRLKPVRTGHKQGEMQLIAFTYRLR